LAMEIAGEEPITAWFSTHPHECKANTDTHSHSHSGTHMLVL